MKTVTIRFYEELNDFLPKHKKKKRFEHNFRGNPSIKDTIESLGIPHGEVDLILANGDSVNFNYLISDGDDLAVYPEFESFDISGVQHLRIKPLRNQKFILDVHLGTLARYLRMCGFDSLYRNDYNDEEIVKTSLLEKRTILTRDTGILKRSEVTHGCYVRSSDPRKQIIEIVERSQLRDSVREFSRCLECNSVLEKVPKEEILTRIPPKVKNNFDEFFFCRRCEKVYWKGSHYQKMKKIIEEISTAGKG